MIRRTYQARLGYPLRWAASLVLLPRRLRAMHGRLQQLEQRSSASTDPQATDRAAAAALPAPPSLDPYARLSFSQFGEDLVLKTIFEWRKGPGFYVDVGAHHPRRFSNTHAFYLEGWRGINIDADEELLRAFAEERPDDINVVAAVSDVSEPLELLVFSDRAVNTLSKEKSADYQRQWPLAERRQVVTQRLDALLDQHLPPGQAIDLLSVDVEGCDLKVLSGNNWDRYRPKAAVVEVEALDLHDPLAHPVVEFMTGKGYRLAAFLHLSAFFVRPD